MWFLMSMSILFQRYILTPVHASALRYPFFYLLLMNLLGANKIYDPDLINSLSTNPPQDCAAFSRSPRLNLGVNPCKIGHEITSPTHTNMAGASSQADLPAAQTSAPSASALVTPDLTATVRPAAASPRSTRGQVGTHALPSTRPPPATCSRSATTSATVVPTESPPGSP